jgi:DNA-binding CsgD family transcriptional regulator
MAARVMSFFASPQPATVAPIFPELTEREVEILRLIARGHTNQDIAEVLVLSLKTLRNHVANICGKLQVADRAQAIIRAREAGMQYPACAREQRHVRRIDAVVPGPARPQPHRGGNRGSTWLSRTAACRAAGTGPLGGPSSTRARGAHACSSTPKWACCCWSSSWPVPGSRAAAAHPPA